MDTGEEPHRQGRAARLPRARLWIGLSAIVVTGLIAAWLTVPSARGEGGPYTTLPRICSLLDPATLDLVMPAENSITDNSPGSCGWKATTGANTISISLRVDLASAGAGISAVDNGRRIFPVHSSSNVSLAGLAEEASEQITYQGSEAGATVGTRAANMLLGLTYHDNQAQPGYLAEMAEVLARQALRNAVGDVANAGSTGKPASTRSVAEVVRTKAPFQSAEARYRKPVARAVSGPFWMASDDTVIMGFFEEFAFKVPERARCDFLGTHWRCVWAVPGESLAAVDISLRQCRPSCQDEWPFRAADWPAGDQTTQVSTKTFDKLEIDDVTYRDHVQISMKHPAPGYHVNVQVVVPQRHAATAQKIVSDIRFQAG